MFLQLWCLQSQKDYGNELHSCLLCLCSQPINHTLVFLKDTYINLLDDACYLSDSLCWSTRDTSGDDVHVNFSSGRISGTLLHGRLDESYRLFNISLLYGLAQSHFSKSLWQSDHWFKLSRCGSDSLLWVSKTSHLSVLLDKVTHNIVRDSGLDTFSCIRNILGKELSVNLVRFNKLSCLTVL